ncbi:MAG: BrnT family toxin [Dehalococcoidia bacterium]|nr:BrnT family toxin [Dehalococcoidia bacterium]
MYNIIVEYEWDAAKSAANVRAGRPSFEIIEDFEWETAVIFPSPRYGESRWAAIGLIGNRLYFVVYTPREGRRRIISLRSAGRQERTRYVRERT